jgi:hypothetical protein
MTGQLGGAADVEFATGKPACGVGDRAGRRPPELAPPIILQRTEIHIWSQLCPGTRPPWTRNGGIQQAPGDGQAGGVRRRQIHHTGSLNRHRQRQKAEQIVDVQQPQRPRRPLRPQQGGHRSTHHPVGLATHQRRDPDDQARRPTCGHQHLGFSV